MSGKKRRTSNAQRRTSNYGQVPAPLTINVNTILGGIGTIMCGVILYMVTTAMSSSKQTATDLNKIVTTLPFMQKSIDNAAADVKDTNKDLKEAKSVMITRPELENKHARLQESIKEVKEEVKEVKTEQNKVREELLRPIATPVATPTPRRR
jgi:cell shape-determining protein MreC